jgi:hypothetical protein
MRVPAHEHRARPWRIHDVVRDFHLEDVWALPVRGGRDDFPEVVRMALTFDPSRSGAWPVRALFALRWRIGALLGWDAGSDEGVAAFTPMYETGDEYAAEIANRTVHGVLHLGWVPLADGLYRAEMAVYVKRNGLLGTVYMAAINPFRYAVVYPLLLRDLGHRWEARRPHGSATA